jgi:hypothetical protein
MKNSWSLYCECDLCSNALWGKRRGNMGLVAGAILTAILTVAAMALAAIPVNTDTNDEVATVTEEAPPSLVVKDTCLE